MPPTYVGWKLYYHDGTHGSTFSSKDGRLRDAPRLAVQRLTVFYSKVPVPHDQHPDLGRNYRKTYQGADFYWIKQGNPPTFGATNRVEDIPGGAVTFDSGPYIEWEPFLRQSHEDWDWDAA